MLVASRSSDLVKAQRKQLAAAPNPVPTPTNTRLTLGDYLADVLMDARHNAKVYHWIVQRVGSAAIIQWGQEYTFEEARAAAQSYLEKLHSKARPKQA
jgi:hypothetical protein